MAAEEPKPVFATSGLEESPFDCPELKVIEVKGWRDANDSAVNGSPRASIYKIKCLIGKINIII